LKRHAGAYRDDVLSILCGAAYEFNLNVPLIQALQMYGIIKANSQGNCKIANAIYETVLLAAFRSHRSRLQAVSELGQRGNKTVKACPEGRKER
jgi:hypothetical protein